jgi:multiple sugar transport system substrate-binding protein
MMILLLALAVVFVTSVGVFAQYQPVVVELWMHVHAPRVPLDEELLAQFEAENPNIDVEFTLVPDQEWDTTLNTAIASGDIPDLFNQATFAIGQFYAQGLLAPVDPVAAGYEDMQAIIDAYAAGESLLAGAMFDGQLYGLPTELSTYACYTNDDLWAAAGLDPATDFPETWEEMAEVAQQLTVRDDSGAITQRGFDFIWSNNIFMLLIFNAMVQQLGGDMIDEVNYTAAIDTPEVRQVMEYWNNVANEWMVGGPQYEFIRTSYLAGNVAIDCDGGNWFAPQAEDAGLNYSIHPIPRWEGAVNDNGFANYAYYFMVSASAPPEVQQAAWKLAGFLTSFPDRYLETAGLFQGKADFVESEAFQQNTIMPVFLEELSKSRFHPRIAGFFEVADALMRARDRIIVGGEDMDTVLAEAEVEVNEILARAQAEAGG